MRKRSVFTACLLLLAPLLLTAQERVDLNVIHKIKAEELGSDSKVMDTMYNLTDRYGPRLTNSPQFRAAGEWAVGQLKEWGLSNVHLEKWATVPKDNADSRAGSCISGYSGAMVEPTYMPIIGYPAGLDRRHQRTRHRRSHAGSSADHWPTWKSITAS